MSPDFIDDLMQASHKLAEELYKQTAEQQVAGEGAEAGPQADAAGPEPQQPKSDGEAVDAEFEVVDDEKEKG